MPHAYTKHSARRAKVRSPPRFFVQVFVRAAQVILLRYYQAVRAEKCMEKRGAERAFARRAECLFEYLTI